jgi:hypothetical protein
LPLRWLVTIFLLALLLRAGWGAVALVQADDSFALEFPDEQQYWLIARSFWAGDGLRDELGFRATRMPLYPAMLSVFTGLSSGVFIAKAFHWVIGAATASIVAGAATTFFVDHRTGIAAGLIIACDPFLVFFSSLLLTETLFIATLVGFWWMIGRLLQDRGAPAVRWIVAGLLGALCVYVRESGAGLVAAAVVFVVVCHRFDRRTILGAAITVCVIMVALLPWAARNRHVMGKWCWLTTRGGISLYDGVGPQATGASDLGNVKRMPAVSGMSEVEWNDYFLEESYNAIRAEPTRILRLAGTKLARTWNPLPNVETYQSHLARTVSAAWMLPVYTFAAIGALLLFTRKRGTSVMVLLLLLPAVYLSVLHSLFVGSVRYRLSAVPMIEMLAAVALVAILNRCWNTRTCRGRDVCE